MEPEYDAELLDSSRSSSVSASTPKQTTISITSWPKKVMIFLICLLLIFCVSIEMVAFKSTATAFPFSACFVICLFLICHSICCFIICLYKIHIISTYDVSILNNFPFRQYFPMGIFRSLSISIIFIAISREIQGSLLIIILQTATPLSIIMSRFVSSISIHSLSRAHWTAIILTFIGVIFGFIASYLGNLGSHYIDYKNDNKLENAWWYLPIIMVAMLPHAASILYNELKLTPNVRMYPMELIHATISLQQCFVTFILSPVLIYLSDPETLFWNDWYRFLHYGFLCLFRGDSDINNMYCPHGHFQSIMQFVVWLFMSILVQLLTNYILNKTSAFIQRFCVLMGLLFAFICFQIGFPSILTVNGSDAFDECLLLGVLCSFVGSVMLLIDFNPNRTNTLLDSIQFDELNNHSTHIQNDLLSLKQQHESLSMSQQEIKIDINDIANANTTTTTKTTTHRQNRSKSLQQIYYEPKDDENVTDVVGYLLMEQQKEIIMEQYQTKLAQYKQAKNQKRSQSFHSEFYAKNAYGTKNKKKYTR